MTTRRYIKPQPSGIIVVDTAPPEAGKAGFATNLFADDARFNNPVSQLSASLDQLKVRFSLTADDWFQLREEFESMTLLLVQGEVRENEVQMRVVSLDRHGRYHLHRFWRFGEAETLPLTLSRDLSRVSESEVMYELMSPA